MAIRKILTASKHLMCSCLILIAIPIITYGKETKPNIILINVDDLGWKDLGFMGSAYYETPNLDKLAGQGMVFYHAYAAAANCAPSRACMMSGRNTPGHGVYTVDNSERGNAKTRKIIPTPNRDFLPDSMYTLAKMLKDNGYINGTFGKWHINEDPLEQGFHVNVGGSHRGNPGSGGYFSPYKIDFIENGPEGEYLTDRLTNEAIAFVKENKENPFFLYLPFYSVHTPIMGKEELIEKFDKKSGGHGQDRADYAAMVASVDENVGKLLDVLDSLELTENTFLIFTSDNGGIRDISYQTPLRAGKGSYYEGGIRVPLVIRWPGRIHAGSTTDFPVTNMDFYPTIKSIINADTPGAEQLEGLDLSPLFGKESMEERPLFWHFPVYLQAYNPKEDGGKDPLFRTRPGSVVRKGKWKLHHYFEENDYELYNLEEDPGETNNLAENQTEIRNQLIELLSSWREGVNAPVPSSKNPLYDRQFEMNLINEKLNE
ncbi:sulfatase [Cyclobacterium jeungdonense]|uniref:Sulfatase n=1 Tax=Cyclobacterium jeungdonense TaxID=708087 RepID=A0ABT8CDN5_9BACT|nr:sulfatase [Cyclobacterium jeungdonense]MDN3689850.1 sulfatase [Cyclobacterium jeungdonense]